MTTKHKPHELELRPIPLTAFFHDPVEKILGCEASDIGPCRDGLWWLQQLYNDAVDIGIAIHSHLTGKTERFVLTKQEKNRDGDITALHFKPLRHLPTIDEVIIFND